MRQRFAGRTSARKRPLTWAVTATALSLAAVFAVPSLQSIRAKEQERRSNRTVALAVSADDVRAFVPPSAQPSFWDLLREIPVAAVFVREGLSGADESALRARGFALIWELEDGADSTRFPARISVGDGVRVAGEFALESPGLAEATAARLRQQKGFLAGVEFEPRRRLMHLPSLLPGQIVRSHIIPTRETVRPKPGLWTARLSRAVRERWVRLLSVRFSSAWSPDENVAFLRSTADRLRREGFALGAPEPPAPWKLPFGGAPWAGVALAALAPVAVVGALARHPGRGALVPFTVATAVSALAGVIVHGIVASPSAVVGVSAARGVKIQLLLPLLLSAAVLVEPSELAAFFRRRVTWGDLVLAGLLVGAATALYLMRSGNDPLLGVTDAERSLRDFLETRLGARPRFKEFAIGHPLLIAGLYLRGRGRGFAGDGRLFLLLGVIGQISVINTFTHAPAAVETSLLRTIHGWWAGALVSLPLCHLMNKLRDFRAGDRMGSA